MTTLVWDGAGDRVYETGVDRGVLYLADGSGVPWNGLTSVEDKSTGAVTPLYFDGVKYDDIYVQGDFVATLKAYTYPDEFMEFEGVREAANGFFVSGQTPKTFGLSYRTLLGNDVDPQLGYKIHILSNLLAVPTTRTFRSNSRQPSMVEFEWTLSAVPSKLPGYRPTPHLIFDTTKSTPEFVTELEGILYGTALTEANLPAFIDLVNFATGWIG